MIKVENLSKTYGSGDAAVNALKNVSLQIEDGEMTAIMGVSGSGKSTLLHILGGLDTEVSGSVFYDDTNITDMDDIKLSRFRLENVGFVFQLFNLIPELTAAENITLPQMMSNTKKGIPEEIVSRLGLSDRLKHYPDELSGGQKQRVAIARALINDPQVIFADEPTGALDSTSAESVLGIFEELNKEMGKTIVIVTHDPKVAEQCGRVIEISDGKIKY